MTLSDEKIAEIRRGCEGLKKETWRVVGGTDTDRWGLGAVSLGEAGGFALDWDMLGRELIAAHIARLDPQTVLALLDERDDLKARLAAAEALVEEARDGSAPVSTQEGVSEPAPGWDEAIEAAGQVADRVAGDMARGTPYAQGRARRRAGSEIALAIRSLRPTSGGSGK